MSEQSSGVVKQQNKKLYGAYLLKEALADALDHKQPKRAAAALKAWLSGACRSRLRPFVRVARVIRMHHIRMHHGGVLACIKERLTNGVVEGTNSKIRVVARRAYGFHSAAAPIAMVHLCAAGISLNPPMRDGRISPTIDAPLPTQG